MSIILICHPTYYIVEYHVILYEGTARIITFNTIYYNKVVYIMAH